MSVRGALPSPVAGAVGRIRQSYVLAVVAALAVVILARAGPLALTVAAGSTLVLVVGVVRRRRGWAVLAGGGLFTAAVVLAATTGDVRTTLAAAFAAVLATDLASFGLGVERDTGPDVATTRVELLHAVGSSTVAVLAGGLGYALYRSVPAGSGLGVLALLFAAVVLTAALR